MADLLLFFVFFLLLAAVLSQDSFVFTLFYFFAAVTILGRWWSGRALGQVKVTRSFSPNAFPGEQVPVRLEVSNSGWLPLPWLQVRQSLPWELRQGPQFQTVLSLGGRQRQVFTFHLLARKRGVYPLGPLAFATGDLLGLSGELEGQGLAGALTVFPQVVPLGSPRLPSRLPQGTLRRPQAPNEDTSRTAGKRDYQPGDSLRRVDWKTSAALGRLQVRQFEPAIDLETAIFLNLNLDDYPQRLKIDASELAITTAASLAGHISARHQPVGLWSNGRDALTGQEQPPLPSRKGRAHLMLLLERLARLKAAAGAPSFTAFLGENAHRLSWGAALLLVTGQVDDELIGRLFQARRAGISPVLLVCGWDDLFREARRRAGQFGIPAFHVHSTADLRGWSGRWDRLG